MPAQLPPHPLSRALRGFLASAAVLVAGLLCAPLAVAAVPNYKGASADGEIVFFETEEQLVPGDTDTKRDVYERSFDVVVGAYVTREVSLGPTGGNDAYAAQFEGTSEDGMRIFFSTEERLVEADTDRARDIYARDLEDGETTLVSQGEATCAPGCGSGAFAVTFAGADAAGGDVFFETAEPLSSGDTDEASDLYVRDLTLGDEETTQVSVGEAACAPGCGSGDFDVSRRGISADGSYAYFTTAEPLSTADGDGALDIYAHDVDTATTSLVSQGSCGGCGDSGAVPIFNGSSADGSRAFFSSDEKLAGADTDLATDLYARDLPGGPTVLISGGTADVTASFAAASADGTHVFFTSAEGLLGGDTDGANDVYEWAGGGLELVTDASCASACGVSFDAVSADSGAVVFTTAAQLVAADTDSRDDIYRQPVGSGEPVLVSRGEAACPSCWNGVADARFNEASADASRVVFTTTEAQLAEDGDSEDDIYLRDIGGEASSLITTSPSYCPLKKGNCGATFVGSSEDGLRVFFRTVERFTLDDGDNEADVYERFLGSVPGDEVTQLVSTGNSPDLELGPAAPTLTGTDPESPGASTTPRVLGEAEAGSAVKLYASPDCSGEPVAAGTAAQLLSPGLLIEVEAGSLTSFRATAESEGFVSACSAAISYEQHSPAGEGGGNDGSGGGGGGGSGGGGIIWRVGGGSSSTTVVTKPKGPAYVAPQTRITFAPAAKTRSRNPVFRFTDATGQEGTSFRCKLDRKPWRACASPLRLKRLKRGRHVLEVTAVNAVGTAEAGAAKRAFKVVPR
jgi:hypothetical protein